MINSIFIIIGAVLPILWGVSHLFPTKSVVKGFGEISKDNRLIITMEWIIEGVTLIFIGIVILIVTLFGEAGITSTLIFIIMIALLNVLSIVSLFTGFRVKFLPFKLCPFIFTSSSIFILLGIIL